MTWPSSRPVARSTRCPDAAAAAAGTTSMNSTTSTSRRCIADPSRCSLRADAGLLHRHLLPEHDLPLLHDEHGRGLLAGAVARVPRAFLEEERRTNAVAVSRQAD